MKSPYKFIDLQHGEIIVLPQQCKIQDKGFECDCIYLSGDYIVFGNLAEIHLGDASGADFKTLRELYEISKNELTLTQQTNKEVSNEKQD